MIYSEQYVGSHDFVDRTIATLANKSLVPADLRLRSRIFRDNGEADTELHLLLDRVLKGKTELPEWARPDVPPPDIVFIGYPMIRLEPYIFRDHLAKCIEDTMSSRYQTTHHYPDLSISTRTWKRLVPPF